MATIDGAERSHLLTWVIKGPVNRVRKQRKRARERETGTGGLFSVKKQRVCAYVRSDPQAGASGAVEDQS